MKALKFSAVILLLSLCAGFFSCSDDDDDVNTNDLIGTWMVTNVKGHSKVDGKIDDEWNLTPEDQEFGEDHYLYMQFDENKKVYEGDSLDKMTYDANWEIDGNYLVLIEDGESIKAKILTLNSNELVVELYHKEYDEYDGKTYEEYEVLTFKKI